MSPAPQDRPIMVLTREEGLWLPVQWSGNDFRVIGGDGSWVEADEVEAWSEPIELEREIGQAAA